MDLLLFRSLWTNGFSLKAALSTPGFDGVEGPLPTKDESREEFIRQLLDSGKPFIAEIATGGGYVPTTRSSSDHLNDFKRKAEQAVLAKPIHVTALAGCDAWPLSLSVDWLSQAIAFAEELQVSVSFETHRSRPTFSPWATRELLEQLPKLRLTCDFSHWCCVTERLVMNEEPDLLSLCAARAAHVHARVGYDQGPQVPHPAAPEFSEILAAHEEWWDVIWSARARAGHAFFSMTPEFGPDGYLQCAPFTQKPVADLDEINLWIAQRQSARLTSRTEPSLAAR